MHYLMYVGWGLIFLFSLWGKVSKDFDPDVFDRLLSEAQGFYTLHSCGPDEQSYELKPEDGRNGVFTHFLLKALEGEADKDGNAYVDFDEVFEYVYQNVKRYVQEKFGLGYRQTPRRSTVGGGLLPILPIPAKLEQKARQKQYEVMREKVDQWYDEGKLTDLQFGQTLALLDAYRDGKLESGTKRARALEALQKAVRAKSPTEQEALLRAFKALFFGE